MGIYIKDIEMPKDGYIDVRIFAEGHANIAVAYKPYYEELPVVEVPDGHGRLVDADVVYDKIAEADHAGNYVDMDAVGMALEDVPTIIEADN